MKLLGVGCRFLGSTKPEMSNTRIACRPPFHSIFHAKCALMVALMEQRADPASDFAESTSSSSLLRGHMHEGESIRLTFPPRLSPAFFPSLFLPFSRGRQAGVKGVWEQSKQPPILLHIYEPGFDHKGSWGVKMAQITNSDLAPAQFHLRLITP